MFVSTSTEPLQKDTFFEQMYNWLHSKILFNERFQFSIPIKSEWLEGSEVLIIVIEY